MRPKSSKILVDIRARLKVQKDSVEAQIHEYLKDENATPYEGYKLIIDALRTYYLPLVNQYQGASHDEIRQSLIDVNQAWLVHFRYLQQRLGIDLTPDTPTPVPSVPTISPVPVPLTNLYEYPGQYQLQKLPPQPQEQLSSEPLQKTEPQTNYEENTLIEEQEEGSYPTIFQN